MSGDVRTSNDDLTPVGTTTITCKIDSLSGGRVGLGVFTEGGSMTQEGADCAAALLETIQDFCDINRFPINVRRSAQ